MFRKIANWTFGSVFRTFGRIIAYLIFGIALSYLLSSLDFRITDLFLDDVKASSIEFGSPYYNDNGQAYSQTGGWSNTYKVFNQSGSGNIILWFKSDKSSVQTYYDYVDFWFYTSYTNDGIIHHNTSEYTCVFNSTEYGHYQGNNGDNTADYDTEYELNSMDCEIPSTNDPIYKVNLSIIPKLVWDNGGSTGEGGLSTCSYIDQINGISHVRCDVKTYVNRGNHLHGLRLDLNYSSLATNTINVVVNGVYRFTTSEQQDLIDSQNQNTQSIIQQQQNATQQILDSNTTEADNTGKDFINNFSNDTHGLTGIITAPLNAIQSMASATCTPLVLPLPFTNNKTLTLPCMNQIYSQYFGAFYTMYQGIILGLISYWVCVRIFGLAKGFKDPEDDKIEVVDL